MTTSALPSFFLLSLSLFFPFAESAVAAPAEASAAVAAVPAESAPLRISLRQRVTSDWKEDKPGLMLVSRVEDWKPAETAIIVCDMWDKHWCTNCTARVAEMAHALDATLAAAREKGVLIVHAPSECMGAYADAPQRAVALKYSRLAQTREVAQSGQPLASEKGRHFPIDANDGGCDCPKKCKVGYIWKKEIPTIRIAPQDIISDSGNELYHLFRERGVKNVVLTGVATNMCIMARPFGLRVMKRAGFNVALMRDMTDVMYNPARPPRVNHFSGLDLMVEYIESYVCPTLVSSDFTGKKQFRFKEDTRKRIAFLMAEGEYHANQRLPEFARELVLKNYSCDFAIGVPKMNGPGRHNLENLQILEDANLAVLFVRRRALPPEKMALVKNYFASGRPVLGLRTSTVAFDAAGTVPKSGGNVRAAGGKVAPELVQWKELDRDIWGGNYKGHYEHRKDGTDITILAGAENHPLLKGVTPFNSLNWLYKNAPLRSTKARVLLQGWNPKRPPEPVFWTNGDNVIYTSLGHWRDWDIPSFKNLMFNSVNYLLKQP
ncbi:MAG: hypothetical protein LBT53_05530 [Puniceicoccales bacterium]|jgi:nicotinamidase-related amidase|nr:hypothetical protein [Puniceicoccales bacterium]